ncbi:MAG: hypothetical protein JWO79_3734 [Actinomycetia bacterium]|nr:hypothetical protein [Actinomycetes bacterium]MDQ1654668.1 hypothetical protein [Cryptosporangiaceae bacterium]
MIQLLIVITCVTSGIILISRAMRDGAAPAPSKTPASLYLEFVRSAEPRLAALTDARLLELGHGTCTSLRDYYGDADLTVAEAVRAGASPDVVLPVVIGAGFFLAPEFALNVRRIAIRPVRLTV